MANLPLSLIEFGAAGFGWLPYSAIVANNTTGVVVKANPGLLESIEIASISATIGYLRLYDEITVPVTTDTPVLRFLVPGATTGGVKGISIPGGYQFVNGIGYRFTCAFADNDATAPAANSYLISLGYK